MQKYKKLVMLTKKMSKSFLIRRNFCNFAKAKMK